MKKAGSEYEWYDGGEKITIRGNLWFNQYEQEGGDAIDFVRRFFNKDYPETMDYLLGDCQGKIIKSPPVAERPKAKFGLPKPNDNMNRVFAYLMHRRGIDRDVLYSFVHHRMIYESKNRHNAVFVGYDTKGNPRHAHKRGTGSESTYKGNAPNGIPEYSFHWHGRSKYVCLFEAPIDMLSFISMHKKYWQQHSYAAACSVSDRVLLQMLKDNPNIQEVFLCLDNDEAGQKAAKRISDKLFVRGVKTHILVPNGKDWNDDLLALRETEEREVTSRCQMSQSLS